MDSSFWLGECVWHTLMMLWLIFGGSTLGICGVMGIAKLDATVHYVRLPGPGGLSAASTWTVRAALAATRVACSFMDWSFNSTNNRSTLLILIQISDL
jgi:hypothetical protein